MPAETGLPPYVSKDNKTGNYQYYRRPSKRVVGKPFIRSFGTKDKKVVASKYGAIHAEAEAYFVRLISGRSLTDREIEHIVLSLPMPEAMLSPQSIPTRADLDRFIDTHGDDRVRALNGPNRERLKDAVNFLNGKIEAGHLVALDLKATAHREFVAKRFGNDAVPALTNAFTLKNAYEQAWKPAKDRGKNTVVERHGMMTFFLAKEHGKTEDSRRVIPIPRKVIDLGFLRYLETRPKKSPLFEDVTPKLMSQTYGRMRADLGITRRGADVHAHRHHIKMLLSDLGCPDRVSDYVTGHAPPSVSGRYGKTELTTALQYLNQINLGVKIGKWKKT